MAETPEMPEEYKGWTIEQLQDRMKEIEAEVEKFEQIQKTIEFIEEIAYLRDEGFIELEHCDDEEIRVYPKDDAWYPDAEPTNN